MKNIYITWHYTTHGAAYFKHILSALYKHGNINNKINLNKLNQIELNKTFDTKKNNGFKFDEIIYFIAPQEALDHLSSVRWNYRRTILDDEEIQRLNLTHIYEDFIANQDKFYKIESDLKYVKEKYPNDYENYKRNIWRNIHDYTAKEQAVWLTKYSNFNNIYKEGEIKFIELDVKNLRDEKEIASAVKQWLDEYFKKKKEISPIINVSLGSNETQVAWHALAEGNYLPANTRFIKSYDDKSDKVNQRFKEFFIHEIDTKLISSIGSDFKIYEQSISPSRVLASKKIKYFIDSGFSILLLGERGIGKSNMIKEINENGTKNLKIVAANCASFDDDSKAEAELFGYVKGAFTGANNEKKGLLLEADGGVLFLDEVHYLSKLVQGKLMKSLQTDAKNKMSIRRLGATDEEKIECKLIFASNKSITELKEILLPDFYDRIAQHIINIPPLRETPEDRIIDWKSTWKHLFPKSKTPPPMEKALIDWIRIQPLYGNFRDLQKIAMYYNIYNTFDEETKALIEEKSAFEYAKNEFKKYHSPTTQKEEKYSLFDAEKTTKEMIANFKFDLQKWAVKSFGSREKAIEYFKQKGDSVTPKTFNNWQNKKQDK